MGGVLRVRSGMDRRRADGKDGSAASFADATFGNPVRRFVACSPLGRWPGRFPSPGFGGGRTVRGWRRVGFEAFTRPEALALLVSLGLLGLLGLPSLARNRGSSEAAVCLSNLRQLLRGYQLYSLDNADRILGDVVVKGPKGEDWHTTGAGGYWAGPYSNSIFGSMTSTAALAAVEEGLRVGPLWLYAPEVSYSHCPADRRAEELKVGKGWAFDSYAIPTAMASRTWDGTVPFRRLVDVPEPASTLVFVESCDPRGWNFGTWVLGTSPVGPKGWVDPLAAQHDGGAQFVFLDGHTEFRRWVDASTQNATRSAMEGKEVFFWAGGNASNPDFVWVWNRVRYPGWRPIP